MRLKMSARVCESSLLHSSILLTQKGVVLILKNNRELDFYLLNLYY